MARKQTSELKGRVLSRFPKFSKIKHYRSGGFNNEWTHVEVISEAGNILARDQDRSLEQALQKMVSS